MKKSIIFPVVAVLLVFAVFMVSQQSDNLTSGDQPDPIQTVYAALSPQAQQLYYEQSEGLTKEVPQRLVELDQLTIGCFRSDKVLNMSAAETNLGGQCCGILKDGEAYEAQLVALERFIANNGNIELIPRDPYDIPVEHAQELTDLEHSIQLTPDQQALYDEAITLSHHGGPCCCKCWKWYTMSGLAKKLIVDYDWTAQQIAELWDTSSSCGHDHDTNMHEHYNVSEGEHGDVE